MKSNATSLLFFVIAFSLFSCQDDGYGDDDDDDVSNRKPGIFSVTISEITESSATLNWTIAMDPDGDNITYNVEIAISPVELANSPKVTSLSTRQLKLTDLATNQSYHGRVLAVDTKGAQSFSAFNFTTLD